MGKESVMEHATDATAGIGLLQWFLLVPGANPFLQTGFLLVSIVWVATQIYFKWFRQHK